MPTLHWIGKEKIIKHHLDVPYRVLEHKYGFTEKGEQAEPTESGNLIIRGDNLEALKSLLPKYEGKVKCICIDPPYNTGTENWIYNDNVNHPKIKKWIHQIVGKEGDDLSRHDKWLCMMYPRLKLMHKFLADDGLIFINIDDNELHNLIAIMNEIFGGNNKLSLLVWDLGSGTSAGHFTRAHEYILVYSKNKASIPNFSGGEGFIDDRAIKKIGFKNPASEFTFPKGTKFDAPDNFELKNEWGENEKSALIKGRMIAKNGKLIEDVTISAGWTQKKQMKSWFEGKPTFDSKGQSVIEFYFRENGKIYCRKKRDKINPPSVLKDIASSKTATSELMKILGAEKFDFPKPSSLVKYLIELSTKPGDIVLDSFAGSGTTGHAVLALNSISESRFFILIQMDEINKEGVEVNICENVTAKRIKRVIQGYDEIEGTGGCFDFYSLGQPLFNEEENLNEEVEIEKIREYIWFTETRTSAENQNDIFLGVHNDTGYYFIYEKKEETTLDYKTLGQYVKTKSERYIIYADNCLLPEAFMLLNNIEFKKIPRDITRF